MKQRLVLLCAGTALLLLIAACSEKKASEVKPQPEPGWANTHFGMSIQQIKEQYPAAEPHTWKNAKPSSSPAMVVKNFEISRRHYNVYFAFDAGEKLEGTTLEWVNDSKDKDFVKIEADSAAQSLREQLVEKYGQPTFEQKSESLQEWKWSLPGMNVQLMSATPDIVEIFYSKPDNASLKKL